MINPWVAELQNNKWAMEENALKTLFINLSQLKDDSSLPYAAASKTRPVLTVIDGVAVINISGVLLKEVPWWFKYFGIEATSYSDIKSQLSEAIGLDKVKSIELRIASPGGVMDGLADTADEIMSARDKKPVKAVIEDLGASAAYWLASQANEITANRTAEVGSIGVYTVYTDFSKRAETMGAKVIVIKSGDYKGMGVPGAEITDIQIKAVQDVVDKLADAFVEAVAAGRGLKKEKVMSLATGRMWIAADAKKFGLIDGINRLHIAEKIESIKETNVMENENLTNAAAAEGPDIERIVNAALEKEKAAEQKRVTELTAEFEDEPEFALKAIEASWNVTEAKAEFCDVLRKRRAAEAANEGAEPLQSDGPGGDDAGSIDFMKAAKDLAKSEKIKLGDAYKRIAREQPELYESYKGSLTTVRMTG